MKVLVAETNVFEQTVLQLEKHYGENAYGYLHVQDRYYKPIHKTFVDGGKEMGYDEIDLNGPQRSGN